MAERRPAAKAAAEPDFLQFNDLACETVGGKVSHAKQRHIQIQFLHELNTCRLINKVNNSCCRLSIQIRGLKMSPYSFQ